MQILIECVNPTPELIQAQKPKHHIEMLINQMDLTINSPKLAGRLSQYVRNWEQLTEDRWVLQVVSGYKLEVVQTPWQGKPVLEIQCSTKDLNGDQGAVDQRGDKGGNTLRRKLFFLMEKKKGGRDQ